MRHSLLPTASLSINKPPLWLKIWRKLHLDFPLLFGIAALIAMGLFILYSASNKSLATVAHQLMSFALASGIMLVLAQIPPHKYRILAPWFFAITLILLIAVLGLGAISKGAQRWLNLGLVRFQPSEMMKIAMPMMLAWYLRDETLPPSPKILGISLIILLTPVLMIAKQPDLGTALIIAATGIFVILLTGINWKLIGGSIMAAAIGVPLIWHFMHYYQKNRILTFLNPERDPLGSGYHIIQSKIAIGSGGFAGKGWLHGSQTHLQFLPLAKKD